MRRKEKAIEDKAELEAIIRGNNICSLALTDGAAPYVVPLSYGYEGGIFYFHSALEGRKLDLIRQNGRGALSIMQRLEVVTADAACKWGMRFESIYAEGPIEPVDDLEVKRKGLSILMRQYGREVNDFPEKALQGTALFILKAEKITGKRSGY